MSSSLSRRIAGSLALAAIASTTALAAAPAQAVAENSASSVVSFSTDPATFTPTDLTGDPTDPYYSAHGTAVGWVQDIQFLDGESWQQTYLPVGGVGTFYGALDGGGYLLQFEPDPLFEGHSVKYRLMIDGVWTQAGTYTVGSELAPTLITVTPGTPTLTDDYGTIGDTFVIPNTEGVRFSANSEPLGAGLHPGSGTVTVTAEAQPGYALAGTTTWTLEFTDVAAPRLSAPTPVVSEQPAGAYHNVSQQVHDAGWYQTTLVDPATGTAGNLVTVPDVGSFNVHNDGPFAHFGFSPAPGFSGTYSITYRIQVEGRTADSTWTVTTLAPLPTPVVAGSPTHLDEWGTDWDTYTIPSVPGVRYLVDGEVKTAGTYLAGGDVTITSEAVEGFQLTGETSFELTFDPHGARNVGSFEVGPTAHVSTDPLLPEGATVALLDGGERVQELTTKAGVFAWDAERSRFTYVPKLGFSGTASAGYVVTYRDRDFQVAYTPTVGKPPAPAAGVSLATSAPEGTGQAVNVAVPTGGALKLLDGRGRLVNTYAVARQGTYAVNGASITFFPLPAFSGKAQRAQYVVVDAYGQAGAAAQYVATVEATPRATLSTPARTVNAKQLTTTCTITAVKATGCTVTAYATVNGTQIKVGAGKVTTTGTTSSVKVPVSLTKVGRALAARPQGVVLTLESVLIGTDKKTYKTASRTTVVAPVVKARSIHFKADSATLTSADRAYLTTLRTQLKGVKAITVTGYADSRAPKHYNTALGKARAKAVADLLTPKGSKVKVAVLSRGETSPAADNLTRDGRAQNRRVEIEIKY